MKRPELNGFSGACLEIVSNQTPARVRKTASTAAGNSRLRRQMEKQMAFAALDSFVRTPRVLHHGEVEGRFYFEMEFIPGLDGHRFLETCGPTELRSFADKLVSFLENAAGFPPIATCASDSLFSACVEKLLEVHSKDVGLSHDLVGRLLLGLDRVKQLDLQTSGFCHGDFTLENILVDHQGDLWILDFLDSTFEHPLQDYVKLSQDILGGWFEMKNRLISPAVLCYLHERIAGKISLLHPEYASVEQILLALNFCRILPYAPSPVETAFILKRIKHFCHSRP